MKKLLLLLILSLFSAESFAGSCPDGSDPVKSVSADGTYFVFNCGGGNEQSSSSNKTSKVDSAKSGISIENDPNIDFFKPPQKSNSPEQLHMWRIVDFNNDGLADIIYIGTMNLNSNSIQCTYQVCSDQQIDDGNKPQPALYLSGADGKLHYSPELLVDNRDNKGMALGRQLLIADYNNDKVLDIYIADHGVGKADGYRDSYYLSQPNGTWLESSNTHLSHDNFKVYDHGAATGDIDNDGDMDIVLTAMGAGFWCLMNDGRGFLTKRQCGGSFAFALELADMDNDGDLDAIVGGHENNSSPMLTGIHWNDGQGNFITYDTTPLKQYRDKWGNIPEVSASDLDNDGDMDIVYSRTGKSYKGAAIQIIENLGNKKFKDYGIIPLVSAAGWIDGIRFRDLDKDGDIDLYLSSDILKTSGAVVINNGDFNFSLIMPPESYELYDMLDDYYEIIIKIESSDAFDGRYSFTISRYNENDGYQDQGNGYIEINNGIMTVAKEGRTLNTGSIDLYDSFEGQIDKDGNISAVFTVNALVGMGSPEPIGFRGTIDALQIKGKFDDYFDMIITIESSDFTTKEKTQIEWVDGLYAKSLTDEFKVLSKDFSKSVEPGGSQIIPLGWDDFSGDGLPELVYGIQYWDVKKGSNIKLIVLTTTPGKGFSLFKPIMDIAPYTCNPRSSVIKDFNGDGVNDIFIADTGVDWEPFPGCQNSLILSAPNGKFINATSSLPQILDFTHGVTSGDVDSDGDIDLFVTQNGLNVNVPHYFLRNNGKGRFTKVPDGQLLDRFFSYISFKPGNKRSNLYYTPGLEFVDDDDKLDLILLSGKHEGADNNRIIFGSNSGFKKSDALELQPGRFGKKSTGYNYLVTDIDNDGDNDILILHVTKNPLIHHSQLGIELQVLIQEKNRKFVDKSNFYFPGITFDYGDWNKSFNLIDINNDDKKDIVLTSNHGIDVPLMQQIGSQIKQAPPKVLIRQEDGSFRPLNNDLLTGGEKNTLAGIRPIDIDNDGDIEFVVQKNWENGFTLQVLELTTNKEESMYSSSDAVISSSSSDAVISSPLFDGRYSFTLSRYNEGEGSKKLGNGYIEINNGIMTVAKEGRTLDTGSIDLYDSFAGQIDKKGNIMSSLKIDVLNGKTDVSLVDLNGSIDSPLQGKKDHYFDVILKLGEKE
jgi:hypothetical protein